MSLRLLAVPAALALAACGSSRGDEAVRCTGCHATAALTTGAHAAHLQEGPLRGPLACSECHPVPTDAAHAAQPVGVQFATAPGDSAAAGGAQPRWDPATRTCAGTYCHGATLGSAAAPAWETAAGPPACGDCHGVPPGPGGHLQVAPPFCAGCHPASVVAGQLAVRAGGLHLDGEVQAQPFAHTPFNHALAAQQDLASCTPCHGAALDQHCNTCHEVSPP
ncbi:MAG: CxxxxCH/CxxCH domain-containing protein [Anaeromyxobacter sp.]